MTTSVTTTEAASAEETAIRKVVQDYYVGLRDADVVSLGKAFNDLAVVCGYIETERFEKHVKTLYDYVLAEEPPSKKGDPFKVDITAISVAGKTAVVTIEEHDYLGYDYQTSLHLINDADGWSIVSKLFNGTKSG